MPVNLFLRGFLQDIALVSDADGYDDATPKVALMTMHAAKGLEFPVVFIAGVEEDLLPHKRAVAESELGLEEERPLYYHIRFDVLAQDKSWFVHNDTDLIYLSDFGLAAGARLSLSHSFIDEANLGDAEDRETLLRLGPLAAYTFFDEPGASFNKPTLLAIAGWWLLHPFRTGEDVSQAVPYIALGFRFEGDLFRSAD